MYHSYCNSNVSNKDDVMPAVLSDVKVSFEAALIVDSTRSSTDERKCLVRNGQYDLNLCDNSEGYIYEKFSSTICGSNSNFDLLDARKNEGTDQTSSSFSTPIYDRQTVADGPEIVSTKELDVHSFQDWPKIIPVVCQNLMRKARDEESIDIEKPYEVDSIIELRPRNGNPRSWKIFIRRHGVECYRKFGRKSQKSRKNYVGYVKRMKLDYKNVNLKKLNKPLIYTEIPKLYQCPSSCENSKVKCGFYICKPYCIMNAGTYYTAARSTSERVITICPRAHETNEWWVQTKDAWEAVCSVINRIQTTLKLEELPVERIYINLGRWQSQAEKGRLVPSECHAHINVVLTSRAIKACLGRSDVYGLLQDSILAPIDYSHSDMLDLGEVIECRGRETSDLFNYRRCNHFCNLIVPNELADCEKFFSQDQEFSDDDY